MHLFIEYSMHKIMLFLSQTVYGDPIDLTNDHTYNSLMNSSVNYMLHKYDRNTTKKHYLGSNLETDHLRQSFFFQSSRSKLMIKTNWQK